MGGLFERQNPFSTLSEKMLYKMVLGSDVLEHIGRIHSPLNLANMKILKLTFFQNTTPDNQRVLKTSCATLTGAYYCLYFLLSQVS